MRYRWFALIIFSLMFAASAADAGTKLEEIGQVSFYMKSGRILKSEVLKEYPATIRILSKGEELVIRKDAIQFALNSGGSEIEISITEEEAGKDKKEEEKKLEPPDLKEAFVPVPEKAAEPEEELPVKPVPIEKETVVEKGGPPITADEDEAPPAPFESTLPGLGGALTELPEEIVPERSAEADVPVDGRTKVLVQMKNGKVYEGVIKSENRKYYFLDDGRKEHKLKKKKVVKVERSGAEGGDRAGMLKVDFYMKDRTTINGTVLEEKPDRYIVDVDGERKEISKKDITFALDEEGRDFKIDIDAGLLKRLEEEERNKKDRAAKKSRQLKEKRVREENARLARKKKRAEKEDNYRAGLKYFGANNFNKAISHFERAVLSDPDFGEAYYRLAFSYYQIGEEELSWKNLEKAKSLGLKQADTLLGIIERDKARRKRKQKIKKVVAWSGGGLGTLLAGLLVTLFVIKRREKEYADEDVAVAAASGAETGQPAPVAPTKIVSAFEQTKITEHGFVQEDEQQSSQGVPDFEAPGEEAVPAAEDSAPPAPVEPSVFDPEKAERSYLKANELCNRGNMMEAKMEYENAVKYNPRLDVAYVGLGYVMLSQGKTRESIREYTKSLDINPNQPEAHYSLGMAYYNAGDISQARYEWKKALLIDPDFQQAKDCLEAAK